MNANRQKRGVIQQSDSAAAKRKQNAEEGEVPKGYGENVMPAVADTLAKGVQRMVVDPILMVQRDQVGNLGEGIKPAAQRVSGLDSFNGSSDMSLESGQTPPASIQERLRMAKEVAGHAHDRRQGVRSPGVSKDSIKAKKCRKATGPEAVAQSFRGIQQDSQRIMATVTAADGDVRMQEPPLAGFMSTERQEGGRDFGVHLTGPHDEARQEK
jgi:hypothetical protein